MVLPAKTKVIENMAFGNCNHLTMMKINAKEPPLIEGRPLQAALTDSLSCCFYPKEQTEISEQRGLDDVPVCPRGINSFPPKRQSAPDAEKTSGADCITEMNQNQKSLSAPV